MKVYRVWARNGVGTIVGSRTFRSYIAAYEYYYWLKAWQNWQQIQMTEIWV